MSRVIEITQEDIAAVRKLAQIAAQESRAKFTRATDRAWFALKKPRRYWADWILRGFGL